MNTEPNTEPKAKKFWEVTFSFVSRKECRAIVEAATQHEAEALIEELSSDVLDYRGGDGEKFVEHPECDYEEETVEDIACYGPLTEEDL